MVLLLLTIDNCPACKAMKSNLDTLAFLDNIQLPIRYKVVNVERAPSGQQIVEKYSMLSAPLLLSPTGSRVEGSRNRAWLKQWLENEYREWKDSGEPDFSEASD